MANHLNLVFGLLILKCNIQWYPEIRHFIPNANIVLIGVKSLARDVVDPQEVKSFIKHKKVSCYVEADAEYEMCLNVVVEEGLKVHAKKQAKKQKRSLLSLCTF
jgi:hypothetical protein